MKIKFKVPESITGHLAKGIGHCLDSEGQTTFSTVLYVEERLSKYSQTELKSGRYGVAKTAVHAC